MMDGETGQATSFDDAKKYAEENDLVLLKGNDIIKKYLEEY
jgi:3,4-dihydroxy 2-butanone 4-phosphate synthase